MKEHTPSPSSAIPRSRFRPLSLPVYLDNYKAPKKRMPRPPVEPPLAASPSPKQQGFQITSSIPRMLRPSGRSHLLLSRPRASAAPTPLPSPLPLPTPKAPVYPRAGESRCCQMLIHGLYIAFEDDFVDSGLARSEDLRADGGREFTHFISLSTHHKASIKESVDPTAPRSRKAALLTHRLRLRLPRLYSPIPPTAAELEDKVRAARAAAAARGCELSQEDYYDVVFDEGEGSGFTGLEALQLLAARDFLGTSGLSGPENDSGVRVLVTTPRDHRTDAIAVVMGYLSGVLGTPVRRILRTQDGMAGVLPIWKRTVSAECAAFIEEVARL
ncbi:hypothetical protein C8F04DRAFT_1185137 [Mycena alexandri]|uniref:Uncharacterized protein n=1 Tax=Mycena alexandri TaxID=1745969 RepID=A0AAD6X0P8_9AGAR|nr:hypothetical protein C8F04DRAFT_1185137 [Mycena alexandri]